MLVFHHIPKTAGSTLFSVVQRFYDQVVILDTPDLVANNAAARDAIQAGEADLVWGHFHYGVQGDAPVRAFTMLRDPVDRMVSEYYYIRRRTDHPSHEVFQTLPLEECVERLAANDQVKWLAGVMYRPAAPDDLPAAQAALAEGVDAFGLQHRFDESLLWFRRICGWPLPLYRRKNVSRRPRTIPEGVRERIADRNALDAALFDFACDLFEERLPVTAGEVALFDGVNTVAQQVVRLRDAIKPPQS